MKAETNEDDPKNDWGFVIPEGVSIKAEDIPAFLRKIAEDAKKPKEEKD